MVFTEAGRLADSFTGPADSRTMSAHDRAVYLNIGEAFCA